MQRLRVHDDGVRGMQSVRVHDRFYFATLDLFVGIAESVLIGMQTYFELLDLLEIY